MSIDCLCFIVQRAQRTYRQIVVVDMRCICRRAHVCWIVVEVANVQTENAIHLNLIMTIDELTFLALSQICLFASAV